MNWFGPTKTLDVHVSALRKKLGDDPAAPRYLHTVRGRRLPVRRRVGARRRAPDEPARAAAGRVRLRARADDRGARGAARAEHLAARGRRGQERGGLGRADRCLSAAGSLGRTARAGAAARGRPRGPRRPRDRRRPQRPARRGLGRDRVCGERPTRPPGGRDARSRGRTAQGTRRSDSLDQDLLFTAVPIMRGGRPAGRGARHPERRGGAVGDARRHRWR